MTFRTPGLQPREKKRRQKFCYIGAPKVFALDLACKHIWEAFDRPGAIAGCYVVGSALERPDWRDVDVVFIISDDEFGRLFPDAQLECGAFEFDTRWLLITVALSAWLSQASGLPIDFKFQPMTHANAQHRGPRHPIGLRHVKRGQ